MIDKSYKTQNRRTQVQNHVVLTNPILIDQADYGRKGLSHLSAVSNCSMTEELTIVFKICGSGPCTLAMARIDTINWCVKRGLARHDLARQWRYDSPHPRT
jgi:hypothetical protein